MDYNHTRTCSADELEIGLHDYLELASDINIKPVIMKSLRESQPAM